MNKNRIGILFLVLAFLIITTSCNVVTDTIPSEDYENLLKIHFIDVGQGDSTLIQLPNGEVSLIDGGPGSAQDKVVKYIEGLGIEEIDHLIVTHPHEDHIGGLPQIVENFKIKKVYMPNKTANTVVFEELLLAIKKQNLNIDIVKAGDYLIDEEQLKFYFLAPNRDDYDETNDFSIVSKIDFFDNSLIVAGDAEKNSEMDMIDSGLDLKADLLRVGHHGGRTSTNDDFLEKVNPKYSIISVGRENAYGHPHRETLERLNKIGTKILRTDRLGDIVFISDGQRWVYETEIARKENAVAIMYIGNKNTKVLHSIECNSLPIEENRIFFTSIVEAENMGYRPHKNCIK